MLPVTPGLAKCAAPQPSMQLVFSDCSKDALVEDSDSLDRLTQRVLREVPAVDFDLGQFWHSRTVSVSGPGSPTTPTSRKELWVSVAWLESIEVT